MNWQAVIDSLRLEQRDMEKSSRERGMDSASVAMILQSAVMLKVLADALQMGLNKRSADANPPGK